MKDYDPDNAAWQIGELRAEREKDRDAREEDARIESSRRGDSRPLPDWHGVKRALDTSRAAAAADYHMCEAGMPDWARGTPMQAVLFRYSPEFDDAGQSDEDALSAGIRDHVAEHGYWIARCFRHLRSLDQAIASNEADKQRMKPGTYGVKCAVEGAERLAEKRERTLNTLRELAKAAMRLEFALDPYGAAKSLLGIGRDFEKAGIALPPELVAALDEIEFQALAVVAATEAKTMAELQEIAKLAGIIDHPEVAKALGLKPKTKAAGD